MGHSPASVADGGHLSDDGCMNAAAPTDGAQGPSSMAVRLAAPLAWRLPKRSALGPISTDMSGSCLKKADHKKTLLNKYESQGPRFQGAGTRF